MTLEDTIAGTRAGAGLFSMNDQVKCLNTINMSTRFRIFYIVLKSISSNGYTISHCGCKIHSSIR